ncbi:MAG: glycosyltransferase family 4 protein [Planctomycetota bacterium]
MRIALNYRNIDPSRGGAETYVADLTRSLIQRGHEVTLVAEFVKPGAVPKEAAFLPVLVHGWSRSAKIWSFAQNSQTVFEASEGQFDATMGFINTWHHDVIIPQGGLRAGSRLHNAERFDSPLKRRIYKFLKSASLTEWQYDRIERLQYAPSRKARVVAVSHLVSGHLQRFRNVPPSQIHVVYNAIDPGRFAVSDPLKVRALTRQKYGLADDTHVGLFVGHNFWLKGLAPLLEALASRQRQGLGQGDPSITLLVSGGGKLGPFRKMADRLGLAQSVQLLGFTPDVKALFHAADFFVSPTYYDPCSLVVMEALACSLPVITTGCNGAGELITHGREGFLIPTPNHQAELVSALNAMTDRNARRQMAMAAHELGMAQTFDAHVGHLEQIFAAVAADKYQSGSRNPPQSKHFINPQPTSMTQSTESERAPL